MKSIELESWAIRILERVENHHPVEDSRVEVKSSWPDPAKTGRRLAGHANAARGESILWLVGADEKQGVITGANYNELANWFPQVKACFESEVPALQDLNVTYRGKTVAALCFDTSRFPYVVKNPKGGEIQFEVPWRDGTAVRSATRNDLVLMLAPLLKAPQIEVLEGQIIVTEIAGGDGPCLSCTLDLYVVPFGTECLTFPFHKSQTSLKTGTELIAEGFAVEMGSWNDFADKHNIALRGRVDRLKDYSSPNDNIHGTEDEVLIKGAGKVAVLADIPGSVSDVSDMNLSITLVEAFSQMPVVVQADFKRVELGTWGLVRRVASFP